MLMMLAAGGKFVKGAGKLILMVLPVWLAKKTGQLLMPLTAKGSGRADAHGASCWLLV